jgi:hypothetical protein
MSASSMPICRAAARSIGAQPHATARQQQALTIAPRAAKAAQIIRADAEAKAPTSMRSFNKDPDFYDFYRAMQSYRRPSVPMAKIRATRLDFDHPVAQQHI